jgi:hypothetical protein
MPLRFGVEDASNLIFSDTTKHIVGSALHILTGASVTLGAFNVYLCFQESPGIVPSQLGHIESK